MTINVDPDAVFYATIDMVEDYLNKGIPPPPLLLRYMIDGTRGRLNNLRNADFELASKQAEFMVEKLGKLRSYNFKWRLRSDVEANTGIDYDLFTISRILLLAYIGYKKDHNASSKKQSVEFFYGTLLNEIIPFLDPKTQATITTYRIQVLVGTLTIAAGYKRAYPSQYKIKEIQKSVQHLMNKIEEQRTIKKVGKK
jgi:hypothetical protein